MKSELFGADNALGAYIRVAGQRFRVVGVLADIGTTVGFDMNEIIFVPVRHTMDIYNMVGVQEVDVRYNENRPADEWRVTSRAC